MTAVIVAFAINIMQESVISPSAWFLFLMLDEFMIAGLLHSYEINCLLHGLIYYLAVPSMYVLLIIFALQSQQHLWGTREIVTKKSNVVINLVHFTNSNWFILIRMFLFFALYIHMLEYYLCFLINPLENYDWGASKILIYYYLIFLKWNLDSKVITEPILKKTWIFSF